MKQILPLIALLVAFNSLIGQSLTGSQLLEKAIAYHDPNGKWPSFKGKFHVTMETPNSPNRESDIEINLPDEKFYLRAVKEGQETSYSLEKGRCEICVNGPSDTSNTCERAKMYKNYYTYLYGLPMKLKDAGTHIAEKVDRKKFKGKEYLVLKVTYDEAVGKDVWFFYFNPATYALEVYQFYKGDPSKEGKNTGEYILLTDETVVYGIKMPKNRAWYYNKDDKYLGTDILKK
ncbi:hypothetical protein ATE92_1296 [Ulvibacter sp. MAR_2010_11]|uniref:DUF6503 family protein n=1 Tax=Ulvibacter sp. MAR_2010_11 TaxID=1250229 RepID=UPI000C2CA8C0|nr:DUF6503 family protein [Ulvibacter sp. MAR_2010_11]PKA83148.1 hypothetical protein ATE92_1296 [Ulvibacter sp. MAR_2010_11]